MDLFVAQLREGQVVAAATESSFGLLADPRRPDALEALFALKKRDPHKPVGLILPNLEWLQRVAEVPSAAGKFVRRFWPGALSLVVPARAEFRHLSPDQTVSVRVPGPSPALTLARAFGAPLTATSANLSGEPPLLDGEAVATLFKERVQVVLGTAPGGPPSTVIRWDGDAIDGPSPKILRRGAIPDEEIYSAI